MNTLSGTYSVTGQCFTSKTVDTTQLHSNTVPYLLLPDISWRLNRTESKIRNVKYLHKEKTNKQSLSVRSYGACSADPPSLDFQYRKSFFFRLKKSLVLAARPHLMAARKRKILVQAARQNVFPQTKPPPTNRVWLCRREQRGHWTEEPSYFWSNMSWGELISHAWVQNNWRRRKKA
jgi:hypothetical protein